MSGLALVIIVCVIVGGAIFGGAVVIANQIRSRDHQEVKELRTYKRDSLRASNGVEKTLSEIAYRSASLEDAQLAAQISLHEIQELESK